MGSKLHFDYQPSRDYCRQLGLTWLGDDYLKAADEEAWNTGFTQDQVDAAMRHTLWHVRIVFTPQSYRWWQRILLAWHFLFGSAPKMNPPSFTP